MNVCEEGEVKEEEEEEEDYAARRRNPYLGIRAGPATKFSARTFNPPAIHTMAASNRAQANGVLAVTASQTSGNTPKPAATNNAPAPKLKIIIRRLPPGLTEAEFTLALGDDWKLGKGRVDWFLYKPGKDSKEQVCPSICCSRSN